MLKRNRAFSLLEILIALAIIGLIASLVVPVVQQRRDKAAYEVSVINLYEVAKAMEKHYLETGKYPVFSNQSWNEVAAENSPLREYLNDIPTADAFGRDYRIETSSETEYRFTGYSIKGKLAEQYPDYSFSTGLKKEGGRGGA